MQITIKYFGLLVEVTGCAEEVINTSAKTISALLEFLISKYPELETKNFQVAQNNTIVDKSVPINQTEIALLPPFSGG
ncbi:MAG: MoaD/ThiS family protein [Flavobacteriaceae bacterium]|nr:MoaD/ThiS family protein [Flavobacteriaceae bacterium]